MEMLMLTLLRLDDANEDLPSLASTRQAMQFLYEESVDAGNPAITLIVKEAFLFRTAPGKTGILTDKPFHQQNVYRMIQRRAKAARIQTRIGNHTLRATGITLYLKNSGKLEVAQQIADHKSPRSTMLYDRRQDEISLDEIEKIEI
jgi:integrase